MPKAASVTKFYDEYKAALNGSGANYENAKPGTKYDLGGGARQADDDQIHILAELSRQCAVDALVEGFRLQDKPAK